MRGQVSASTFIALGLALILRAVALYIFFLLDKLLPSLLPTGINLHLVRRRKAEQTFVENGETINTVLSQLKTLTGDVIELDADDIDTVTNVKYSIKEVTGIPTAEQKLTFEGQPMVDGDTLETYLNTIDFDTEDDDTLDSKPKLPSNTYTRRQI